MQPIIFYKFLPHARLTVHLDDKSALRSYVGQSPEVAKFVFVSGTPAFDGSGKLAVGDFPAQMKQVMDNMTAILKASGAGWDRVVKTNVLLMRPGDFAEMNRIYATYFADGKYPARTTVVVAGLPHPDFLLEIECEALTE